MPVPMKKHHTRSKNSTIEVRRAGIVYQIPLKVAEKYIVSNEMVSAKDVFSDLNKKYTKPGALLRGLRARENLTQVEMAKEIHVTQSDISQMEHGTRNIGRKIAQRIAGLFDIDYRSFLH